MTDVKLEMIDLGGIPLPGQYPGLKGIDLWGDGEIATDGEEKKPKKKKTTYSSDVAGKVADKALKTPIFVEHGSVMPYQEFIGAYGEILDEESYHLVTDLYTMNHIPTAEESSERFLFQYTEGVESNPFFTKWYPPILDAMKRPSTKKEIHKIVTQFVENNAHALSVRYPTSNVMINATMIKEILHIAGMNSDSTAEATTELLANMDANTEFKSISKSPHQVVFTAMLMASYELKENQLASDMVTLVAFTMYPLIFRKYFPVTDPNPQAMEEVVTTASKKFYIAKTNSLLEWVRILTSVPTDFYKEQFAKPNKSDKLIVTYLNRLRNTMNQQFKSLYGVYKKAYDKRSIGKQNEEDYATLGSNQDKVHIYTMGIVDKINGMRFNAKVSKAAAEYAKCDTGKVELYVKEFMSDTQKYGLKEFVSNLLTIYFAMGQHNEFLQVAIKQYSRIFSSKDRIYNDFRKYLERIEQMYAEFDPAYKHRYLFGVYVYFSILTNIGMNQISNKFADLNVAAVASGDDTDDPNDTGETKKEDS